MRHASRAGIAVTGLALLAALTSAPATQGSPTVPLSFTLLNDVSVVSATDAWAVGFDDQSDVSTTSIWHWDGRTWSRIDSPDPGQLGSQLFGVDAVSADDVWAVGRYQDDPTLANTLVEHWDGSEWSVVPSPNSTVQGSQDALFSVSAASSNDVWAAGATGGSGPLTGLLEHWNGKRWHLAQAGSGSGELDGVAAMSPSDAWAAGPYTLDQWDGSTWSAPSGGPASSYLRGVAGVSPSDVWVVGNTNGYRESFAAHWDGAAWTTVPPVDGAGRLNNLFGVTAISSSDVWAVGYKVFRNEDSALLEHWNGTAWTRSRSPGGATADIRMYGVDGSSATDVWAVGISGSGGRVVLHFNGKRWSRYRV